jgi:hypothetical protein
VLQAQVEARSNRARRWPGWRWSLPETVTVTSTAVTTTAATITTPTRAQARRLGEEAIPHLISRRVPNPQSILRVLLALFRCDGRIGSIPLFHRIGTLPAEIEVHMDMLTPS